MTAVELTPMIGSRRRVPLPRMPRRSGQGTRTDATNLPPDVRECAIYGGTVTTAPTPWIAYLAAAADAAGGIESLARRSHVSASTLHRWLAGEITPDRVTVGNVTAVARAIGDDPGNALRAAGHLPPETAPTSTASAAGGAVSLPDRIREIREEMQRVGALRLPPAIEAEAMGELWELLHDVIGRYRPAAAEAGDDSGATRQIGA